MYYYIYTPGMDGFMDGFVGRCVGALQGLQAELQALCVVSCYLISQSYFSFPLIKGQVFVKALFNTWLYIPYDVEFQCISHGDLRACGENFDDPWGSHCGGL